MIEEFEKFNYEYSKTLNPDWGLSGSHCQVQNYTHKFSILDVESLLFSVTIKCFQNYPSFEKFLYLACSTSVKKCV